MPRQEWNCDTADAALSILLPRRADGVDRAADSSFFFFFEFAWRAASEAHRSPSVLFCVGTDLICIALNRPTTTTLGSRET